MAHEAVVFTFTTDGDSTHYYLTLRRSIGEWKGATTNSIPLGDGTVEAVRIEGGKILVDVLERKPGESLANAHSVRIRRTFQDLGGRIEEVK